MKGIILYYLIIHHLNEMQQQNKIGTKINIVV